MNNNSSAIYKYAIFVILIFSTHFSVKAQTETLSTGSFIINMGATNPNTIANGIKPYGMVYDLVRNYNVPVKWVISQTKVKDGVDFTYNAVQYKGGTFIIPAEFRSPVVNARITYWTGQGVVGVTTTSALTVDVTLNITAAPRWTLDAQNGSIAEGYLINAGVTNTAFPGAYNWKLPSALNSCDDFFVMPHADPTWATHSNLLTWNLNSLGSIWAACHATSALENMVNPANRAQQTNFLTQKVSGLAGISGNYAQSNSLILWGNHSGGSVPYIHQFPNDPVAQYLGITDAAHLNGSEQIDVPNQSATGGWNPGAKIIAYDPTQVDVTNPLRPDKTNAAALIVYGRGFDDPNRGFVMYQPAHSHNKGSINDVAAQRAFWNFSFFQVQPKAPNLTVTGISNGQQVTNGNLLNLSVSVTSPLAGVTFSYQWSSTCGGTFSAPTSANTTFNPPTTAGNCVVTCLVSDNCGRTSFKSFPIVVLSAPAPPTVVNDVANLSGSCSPGTSVTLNVLTNDVPNASSITFTSLNQGAASPANAGVWTSDGNGNVTFTPNPNFNGAATITYTVTNTQSVSNSATITVNVGSTDVNGCTTNQVYAPSEINLITLATGSFVSQNGTTANVDELSLDDYENIYSDNNVNFVNFGTNFTNNLVLAIGSSSPLRAKDTINIYWSKSNVTSATMSIQIGQSGTGPWTNVQTFTNAIAGLGTLGNMTSMYAIPAGASGITHIRINPGTLAANSATNVWVDAVEYEYLSCVSKQPSLFNDATTVLEDAPAIINVLANDSDPQGLPLTISRIVTQPANGKVSININGTITYINNTDNATATSFVYEACNSQGFCNTATVNINVTPDACGAGQFRANPPGGAITRYFQYQFVGTNAATANSIATNFLDSKLNQGSGGNDNYGADSRLEVGKVFASIQALRNIFMFNISEIPNTAVVQSATFSAYRPGGNNDVQTVNLHGLTESFVENQVTWTIRSTGTNWGTAGGSFGSLVSSAILNGTKTRYNWDVKSLVNTWVATPANNFGLLLKTGETLDKSHQINTKEIGTLGFRPALTITYVIPEPCGVIGNRVPLAQPDYATVVNGKSVVISPLTNDADVDAGNTFTVTGVYGFTGGSATFTGSAITYTANITPTVPRTERFNYIITDNNGASDTAFVYVTITNAPPSVNSDVASTNSGIMVSIAVTGNDNDPEGGSVTAPAITVLPKNGTAIVVGNNIEYTPGPGFTGKDTLVYQLCETAAGSCSPVVFCDTALVVITVNNRVPVANADSKSILPCYANTINLIGNDTDPENGALTVTNLSALSNPAAGTLVNNNDGTVTFTPAVGYTGTFTFTYTVTDNGVTPLVSAPATVTITVLNPVNTPPNAVNDAENVNMDQVLYISVRDNDTDPENNPLTIPEITMSPLHGTASVNPVNGQIIFTPNPGFYGADSLRYRICDIPIIIVATCSSGPDLCDTATLIITVVAPNTVIAINDENSTWINTPVSGGTLGNDFDPQGDSPIAFNGFIIGGTSYTSGTIAISGFDMNGVPVPNAGTITINANGTYTFTPALNFTGVVNVPYSIRDNNINTAVDTANLRITVNPLPGVANSIIANNDENRVFGGATVSSTLFVNDRDPQGNPFTLTGYMYDTNGDGTPDGTGTVGAPVTVGGVTSSGAPVSNAGTLTINANGTYTFTPVQDFTGSIDVPYTICDNVVPPACANAILHIDVLIDANGPLNDPPQPGDDFAYTKINTPVTSTFITNDSDPNNDPVSLNGTTINTGGPATPIGAPVTTAKGGTVQYFANGTFTYTPPAGYVGPDSVEYEICDVTAIAPQPLCNKAFLHLLVGVNNTTDAINDENSTWQNVNVSGNVLVNDFDAEGHTQNFGSFLLQNQSGDIASGAVLGGVDKLGVPVANAGTLTFDANGNFTFDPDPAFTGTVTVPYRLCDNGNQVKCDTAFLTITVDPLPTTGLNSVIANNDENVSYGAAVGGSLFVNDRDPQGDAFTVTSFVGGTVGTPGVVAGVDLNGNPVANAGTLTINANGTYTFTPVPGFVGAINVPYTITDAFGATSTAILHIDVLKDPNGILNDPPIAGDDFGYTTINKPVTGNFISNDSDPNGNPISYMGVTINPAGPATPIGAPVATAQGGTVQFYANGTYLYTPPAGYVGPDRLPYTICDVTVVTPQPLCADATIHLLVGPGISIAGRVWDDANGNVNINGGENFTNAANTLYVNLVDGSGNVVATTPVAADGSYSFANINPGANYALQLTINQGTVGNPAPAVALPAGWTNTGENRNGTIDGGTLGVIDTRSFGFTNTINFDFGIEQLPNSDNHTTNIPQPNVSTVVVLNGGANPPVLSGIDPEDCNAGCTLATRSVIMDAVPANSDLFYNGVLVINGQQINNFNPNLLEIRMTAASLGSTSTSFQYSYVDLAGKKDPTPATYTLTWLNPLPLTLASFTGSANKCDAVLQWRTSVEINTDKFIIEQSNDGLNFTAVAEVKSANNPFGKSYQLSVSQPSSIKYYRLKMMDKDGRFSYSPIITVRTNCGSSDYMTVYPNPVSTNLTVSFQTAYKGHAMLQIVNAVGQQLFTQKVQITSSANTINLDVTNYVPGLYLLKLLKENGDKIGEVQKIIKK